MQIKDDLSNSDVITLKAVSDCEKTAEFKRVFLHVCCGPCAEWPIEFLRNQNFDISAFFYNPNIHPEFENERRLESVQKLMHIKNIPIHIEKDYMEKEWRDEVWKREFESRCHMCYSIRMIQAAKIAKKKGFSVFTTSLLVSPYQNFGAIVRAGLAAAEKEKIRFLPIDFRNGYRKGQQMAREDGLYRQKYCGCIYSLESSVYKDKIYASFKIDP